MLAGFWRHKEMSDGTYDIGDLIDINRVLDLRDENERRFHAAQARRKQVRA